MMVALLLPLKVVMLLGAGNVPRFFPEVMTQYDREPLIIVLGAVAVAFYGLHILTSRLSRYSSDNGVDKLLSQSQKVVLFENQDKIASNAYQKFAEALASLTFSAFAIVLLSLFYPMLVLILASYFLVAATVLSMLNNISDDWQTRLSQQSSVITLNLNNLGFLLVFVTIVTDFLYFTPPPFFIALLSVILCRLMLVRIGMGISDLLGLQKQQAKIKALFFPEQQFVPVNHDSLKNIWSMLKQPYRDEWLNELLRDSIANNMPELQVNWFQCRFNNGLFLLVSTPQQEQNWLVKLFDRNASMSAQHEATLLTDSFIKLPAPEMKTVTKLADYHCHVFAIEKTALITESPSPDLQQAFLTQLLAIRPPETLVDRYQRSHIMLWEKLDDSIFERLWLVSDAAGKQVVETFRDCLPDIKNRLSNLPLVFDNPVNATLLLRSSSEEPLCIDWGKWELCPGGAAWSSDHFENLESALAQAAPQRKEIIENPLCDYQLAALTASVLTSFKSRQYYDVITMMKEMLVIVENADTAPISADTNFL